MLDDPIDPLIGVALHRGDMVLDLLEHRADEISQLLTTIPNDIAMHEAPWSTLAPGSPVHALYWLLRWCHGVDMAMASSYSLGSDASLAGLRPARQLATY